MLHRFLHNKTAVGTVSLVLIVALMGIFAPVIAPHDPYATDILNKFAHFSKEYPLGTDNLGRCILSRMVYGIRPTLGLAVLTMLGTIGLGALMGLLAGYFRGITEELIMRVVDVMLSFPSQIMVFAVVALLGINVQNVILANVFIKWAWYARMIRTGVMQYRDRNFVQFSRCVGTPERFILFRHLVPSIAADLAVLSSLDVGWAIINISTLSFLGLGVQAPTPEWGAMLSEAKNVLTSNPAQMLVPGIAIVVLVAAFNLMGDAIRDVLDPVMSAILKVESLNVTLQHRRASKKLVEDVSFEVRPGECLGILGESGSGKSMTVKSVLGLLDKNFQVSGSAIFDGQDLLKESREELRRLRGSRITMVLQNPMTCFDPLYRIGNQMAETFATHTSWNVQEIRSRCLEILDQMRIRNGEEVLEKYPHQLSGGMLQRIMIGIAMALQPELLIADEPTTAIDAITQYEILEEFIRIKKQKNTAMLFITHDLGAISKVADRILVMNSGHVVDSGSFDHILKHADDPYTRMLVEKRSAVMRRYRQILHGKESSNA